MSQEQSPQSPGDAADPGCAATGRAAAGAAPGQRDAGPAPPDLASPQFTPRAVLTGMVLGGLFSVCNVYVGLQIGVGFPMSIAAALLGYGFWSGLRALADRRIRPWGILENNINQTASSAGASVASAGLVAPIPALALLTGQTLEWHFLALWVLSVMLVGIAVAVPLREQMLLADKLPFPAGLASAEMLRDMHARGAEALKRVMVLSSAALVSVAVKLCASFHVLHAYALPFSIKGLSARSLTMTLNPSLMLVGIGGLIGFRACCSLLVGAILAYGVLSPPLIHKDYIHLPQMVHQPLAALPAGVIFPEEGRDLRYDEGRQALEWPGMMTEAERDELLSRSSDPAYREAVQKLYVRSHSIFRDLNKWLLWPGVTLMVVASLVSVCFSWRSVVAVLPGRRRRPKAEADTHDVGRVPRRWFVLGLLGALGLSVVLQVWLFDVASWAAAVAVLLTFALALVAARVSGETGLGAVGPMGKVTQLVFGLLVPKTPAANLMAANVTGGAASQCADLLNDLKCGSLLGAAPRLQTLAQLCGALVGALVGSAAYLILIPNPSEMLLTDEWAAPAVATWKAVAELFMVGFEALPQAAPTAMALAALAGVVVPILERVAPRRLRPLVPSPVSVGLAFVIPAHFAISMFVGGLAALLLRHWTHDWAARFLVAICVGIIAGESLTGMGIALERALADWLERVLAG